MVEEGKVTIFVTHGPNTPQRCATPFYMASVALAMDCEAEMIFQIDGALLLKEGIAENVAAKEHGKKVIDFMRDAKEAGVVLHVCSAALELHGMTPDDLIEECDDVVGAAYMIDAALNSDVVLSY